MRISLLVLLCSISLSASAQWYKLNISNYRRMPQLAQLPPAGIKLRTAAFTKNTITPLSIQETAFGLLLSERLVMKSAQHHMRFREYEEASYGFRDLAKIYIKQNKLTQAKWFFLQSNNLSRQQNNDRLTIANLIDLAIIKSIIGDFALAQQDLDEARGMATNHGWQDDLTHVAQELKNLQRDKLAAIKPSNTYAGNTQSAL